MRSLPILLLTATMFTACTSQPEKEIDTSPWEAFGYKGMAGKINRLAGSNSLNCGIRNHLTANDPVNKQMTPADSRTCVKTAIQSKTPLRYGSIRIPTDSYLFEALVLTDTGEYWLINYDSMVDGSGTLHDIEKCKSIEFNYATMTYNGINCEPVSTQEWLSDIPEQSQAGN